MKDGVEKLNREHGNRDRRVHTDFVSRRQKGTGEWLLRSTQYTEWCTSTQRTLLCPGIPGAGKTMMSSIVVDDLWKRFDQHPECVVSYVYCSYNRRHEQTLVNLIASLVRQLLQERSDLPDHFQSLHRRHVDKNTRPSVEELRTLLHATTETYSNVFIVVDALDECTNVDGTRDLLLSELFLLQSQSKTVVCLLTTTRFIPEILDQFEHCATLEIRASDDDVSKYLDGQMSRLAPCVARRNDLRDEIKTTIIKATDGMYVSVLVEIGLCQLITFSRFLLAQLHFSSLTDKTTPKKVRTALESMQKGADALTDAYKTTLDRIKGQPPG